MSHTTLINVQVHTNVEEELELLRLEEAALRRRERIAAGRQRLTVEDTNNDDALNVLHARIEELGTVNRPSPSLLEKLI